MSKRINVRLKKDVVLAILEKKGISQNELARMIPVTSGYMSQMINGTRCPSYRMLYRLLQVFGGCQVEELFDVTPNNTKWRFRHGKRK